MSVTRSCLEEQFIPESGYTDVFKQAMELKRSNRELGEAKRENDALQQRIVAKDREAEDVSRRHAVEIADIERQRDEFRDLLLQKTNDLAQTSDRLQSVETELTLANDTIKHLREENMKRAGNLLYVQERNAYDALFATVLKNSSDRQRPSDRYRDIETNSSNMLWQTLVDQTMTKIRGLLFQLTGYRSPIVLASNMVPIMVDDTTLQPSFLLYVQRHLNYEDMKTKRLTKRQMAEFTKDLQQAMESMVVAWARRNKEQITMN